jgi:hypothetical protein
MQASSKLQLLGSITTASKYWITRFAGDDSGLISAIFATPINEPDRG